MTYSTNNDVSLKISHIKIPSGLSIDDFRDEAYNEINAEIRGLYVVPVDSDDETDMGYLKVIEQNLAAGKLLLDVATANEIEQLHSYASFLIDKATKNLSKIIDQKIVLSGAERNTISSDDVVNPAKLQGKAPDSHSTFGRPMSGIENDAIEGKVDSEKYNSLEDTKTL
ncbi:MAG TPA: hypothetical protein ENJ27_00670, partial [Candidatus Moranbacteria bacterium]|nr:hypothetical protein [Candidatus Moranbacteria bacterium]